MSPDEPTGPVDLAQWAIPVVLQVTSVQSPATRPHSSSVLSFHRAISRSESFCCGEVLSLTPRPCFPQRFLGPAHFHRCYLPMMKIRGFALEHSSVSLVSCHICARQRTGRPSSRSLQLNSLSVGSNPWGTGPMMPEASLVLARWPMNARLRTIGASLIRCQQINLSMQVVQTHQSCSRLCCK